MTQKERNYLNNTLAVVGSALMEGRFLLDDVIGIVENIQIERERRELQRKYSYGGNVHAFASQEMRKLSQPRKTHGNIQVPAREDLASMAVIGIGLATLSGVTLVQGVKERITSFKENKHDTGQGVRKHSWPNLT